MSCKPCLLGHACPSMNLTTPIPCQAGYYANQTGTVDCIACPFGFNCPDPTVSPAPCSDGKYSPGICSECIGCLSGHRYYLGDFYVNSIICKSKDYNNYALIINRLDH